MKKLSANTSCSGCGDRRVKLKDDQYVCVSCEVPRIVYLIVKLTYL